MVRIMVEGLIEGTPVVKIMVEGLMEELQWLGLWW